MDGHTSITAKQFYLMMDRVLPRLTHPPWSALGPPTHVHLGLFVHLVEGLAPGLYFLVRSPDQLATLRASMRPEFSWHKPAGCPKTLPLFHLMSGDARAAAGQVIIGDRLPREARSGPVMTQQLRLRLDDLREARLQRLGVGGFLVEVG